MPEGIADTASIAEFLADEISPNTYLNLMDQYYPAARVGQEKFVEINRRLQPREFSEALDQVRAAGLNRLDRRAPRF